MSKREMWIAAGVVFGFASGQSPLTIPVALVLLGRWAYLDAKACRICNPVTAAIATRRKGIPIKGLISWPTSL
jgi:hypothetical protein